MQYGLPVISLTSNGAIQSAISNDTSGDFIFAQQVFALGSAGDVLLAISTSGNSLNVVRAAQVAKAKGLKIIGLTGASGGRLSKFCDEVITVPADKVHEVQELHLPVYHYLCAALETHFFGKKAPDVKVCSPTTQSTQKSRPVWPAKVELVVFDFDGVFTNNKVYLTQEGIEMVRCDRSDSLLISQIKKHNIPMLILSTETNPVVKARAAKLSIACESGCADKAQFLTEYCKTQGINLENVVAVGNDVNDVEVMKMVGYSLAPKDARIEAKRAASRILCSNGGDGAIREVTEILIDKAVN